MIFILNLRDEVTYSSYPQVIHLSTLYPLIIPIMNKISLIFVIYLEKALITCDYVDNSVNNVYIFVYCSQHWITLHEFGDNLLTVLHSYTHILCVN